MTAIAIPVPELPEVETIRRGLNQLTPGCTIQGGEVLLNRSLVSPILVEMLWETLAGCCFAEWERRGKYLLARLDKCGQAAGYLGVHLRMTGQLLWRSANGERSPHTRIIFQCDQSQELWFVDIRTFGRVWYVPPAVAPSDVITGLTKLGPDPFTEAFTPEYLFQALKSRRRPLKSALLDQGLVAGLGNIYADEVLFFSGLHPSQPCVSLTLSQCRRLHHHIQQTLAMAIAAGGTSFSDYRQVTGINGNYGGMAKVYGRAGEACGNCGAIIEKIKLAGRSSQFCPRCQPLR